MVSLYPVGIPGLKHFGTFLMSPASGTGAPSHDSKTVHRRLAMEAYVFFPSPSAHLTAMLTTAG